MYYYERYMCAFRTKWAWVNTKLYEGDRQSIYITPMTREYGEHQGGRAVRRVVADDWTMEVCRSADASEISRYLSATRGKPLSVFTPL